MVAETGGHEGEVVAWAKMLVRAGETGGPAGQPVGWAKKTADRGGFVGPHKDRAGR